MAAVTVFDTALVSTKTAKLHGQTESGLYSLRRLGLFLKKVVTIRRNTAKELHQIILHENTTKSERVCKDGIAVSVSCYRSVIDFFDAEAKACTEFANQLTTKVVDPIMNYYHKAIKDHKQHLEQEAKLKSKAESVFGAVRAQRGKCLKEWITLKEKSKGFRPPVSGDVQIIDKKADKIAAGFEKQRATTTKAFEKLDALLLQAESAGQEFHKFFEAVKAAETERIRAMKDFSTAFAELERQVELAPLGDQITRFNQLLVDDAARPSAIEDWCAREGVVIGGGGLAPEVPCPTDVLAGKDYDALLAALAKDVDMKMQVGVLSPSSSSLGGGDPLTDSGSGHFSPPSPSFDRRGSMRAKYPPQPPPHQEGFYAMAVHDYTPAEESDLELKRGDIVWVYYKDPESIPGVAVWCQGYKIQNGIRHGVNGTFPSSFISEEPIRQELAAMGGIGVPAPAPPPRPAGY